MAVDNLDKVLAGVQVVQHYVKQSVSTDPGNWSTSLFSGGIPGSAAIPSGGIAGSALAGHMGGAIPFKNGSGDQHLARFTAGLNSSTGQVYLLDRLWHNSGLNKRTTTIQTVDSVAWPPRDDNGTSDGTGVMIAIEQGTASGGGGVVETATIAYTNSLGVNGRTATHYRGANPNNGLGAFNLFRLQAGDVGVRSVQSVTLVGDMGAGGTIAIVAYRIIASVQISLAGQEASADLLVNGMPKLYDNSVLFLAVDTGGNVGHFGSVQQVNEV